LFAFGALQQAHMTARIGPSTAAASEHSRRVKGSGCWHVGRMNQLHASPRAEGQGEERISGGRGAGSADNKSGSRAGLEAGSW
jgi:hypothetical protein